MSFIAPWSDIHVTINPVFSPDNLNHPMFTFTPYGSPVFALNGSRMFNIIAPTYHLLPFTIFGPLYCMWKKKIHTTEQ
jgi:hypothetical protein